MTPRAGLGPADSADAARCGDVRWGMRWALAIALAACSKTADPPGAPPAKTDPAAAGAAAAPAVTAGQGKREDRREPAIAAPALSLTVTIAGAPTTWTG